jgi:hypothetical protein
LSLKICVVFYVADDIGGLNGDDKLERLKKKGYEEISTN